MSEHPTYYEQCLSNGIAASRAGFARQQKMEAVFESFRRQVSEATGGVITVSVKKTGDFMFICASNRDNQSVELCPYSSSDEGNVWVGKTRVTTEEGYRAALADLLTWISTGRKMDFLLGGQWPPR